MKTRLFHRPSTRPNRYRVEILSYVSLLISLLTTLPTQALAQPKTDRKLAPYFIAIAADDDGVIYLADRNLPGIWKHQDGKTEVYFQASKKYRTPLNAIRCLAVDNDGNLLAGDSATREVYRFVDSKPQPLTGGAIGKPMGITVNRAGDIFVTDLENGRVMRINSSQKSAVEVAKVTAPVGICIDSKNKLWVVSRSAQGQVVSVDTNGSVDKIVTGRPFKFPHHLTVSDDGTLRVVDGYGRKVWKVTPGKAPVEWSTNNAYRNPIDIKPRGDGWLVVDPRAQAMFEIDADGNSTAIALPTGY